MKKFRIFSIRNFFIYFISGLQAVFFGKLSERRQRILSRFFGHAVGKARIACNAEAVRRDK